MPSKYISLFSESLKHLKASFFSTQQEKKATLSDNENYIKSFKV